MSEDEVVVVVPAFNERGGVGDVVARLLRSFTHVVVVDDGSHDDTGSVAEGAGAFVVRHVVNRGQGAALQTGISWAIQAGARYVVTFDADGQHDVGDALDMVRHMREHPELDVLLGSRFLGKTVGMPALRRCLLWCAIHFTRLVTGLRLTDTHNGLRVLGRGASQKIQLSMDRMAHASELLDEIARRDLRYEEFPVTIVYSEYSKSRGQSTSGAPRVLWEYIVGRLNR